jgi:hypothetical protein
LLECILGFHSLLLHAAFEWCMNVVMTRFLESSLMTMAFDPYFYRYCDRMSMRVLAKHFHLNDLQMGLLVVSCET